MSRFEEAGQSVALGDIMGPKENKLNKKRRRCKANGCKTLLSVYNGMEYCFAHFIKEVERKDDLYYGKDTTKSARAISANNYKYRGDYGRSYHYGKGAARGVKVYDQGLV